MLKPGLHTDKGLSLDLQLAPPCIPDAAEHSAVRRSRYLWRKRLESNSIEGGNWHVKKIHVMVKSIACEIVEG
jgi:hypothetical protein